MVIVLFLSAGLRLQRQQLAATQAQTAVLQDALKTQQDIKRTVTLLSSATGYYPKDAACASLFLVAMALDADPSVLFQQATGQDAEVCTKP